MKSASRHRGIRWGMCGIALSLCVVSGTALAQAKEKPAAPSKPPAPERPNIILLIGDDHGWPYYGFMGSKDVSTPNLDLLAEQGAVFPLAHSTSNLCRPSLWTFLTGLYPIQYHQRLTRLPADKIRLREGLGFLTEKQQESWALTVQNFQTLPRLLGANGYVSFQGGKFWEGPSDLAGFTEGMSPAWSKAVLEKHGFLLALGGGDGLDLGRKSMQPLFDFLDRHRDQPFFVWYAPMLPHSPFNPPYRFLKYYERKGLSESAKKYYANCTWFDAGVGELVDFLHERGLSEKTLLIYANDNGWEQEPTLECQGNYELTALGGPLGKNSLHDFAFRTPLLFSWPGHIPPGVRLQGLGSTLDLVPTILDYAGVKAPEALPGISLRPVLEGRSRLTRPYLIGSVEQLRGEQGWKEDFQYRGYYLRTPRWHYAQCRDRGIELLYDLSQDPFSSVNVVMDHPDLARDFSARIESWRREVAEGDKDSSATQPAIIRPGSEPLPAAAPAGPR